MNKTEPPFLAIRFLSWFCPPELYEGIEGDILEQFAVDVAVIGAVKAKRRLLWNVMRFFRPAIFLRNKFSINVNQTIMIRNYWKVASRNIMKRKLYSAINAFGLSIGIAFCILIFLYIQDEKSFDQFHANKDLIYRLEAKSFNTWNPTPENRYDTHAWLQTGLREALMAELPEIKKATRFNPGHETIFRYGEKVFTEEVTFVDEDFFSMFSFPLVAGRKDKLFKSKLEVVLTPEIARKYFGKEDPLGKIITLNLRGEIPLTVTGIIEAPPATSSLDFTILVPQENRPGYERNVTQWGSFNSPTFVQLAPGTDLKNFSANLDALVQRNMSDKLAEWRKEATIPVPENVKMLEYQYTRLGDIHLKKEVGWHKVSDPKYSWILGGIAVLILLIACINYISLALTTSASRRTEVGIRKVVGAQKKQLVYQFGFESILLALISTIVSFGLVFLFLPSFNAFTGKEIQIGISDLMPLIAKSLAITALVGILAGCYPALFLSGFRPAVVLKGRFTSRIAADFTKPLVVLQFTLSGFLIISSLIMYRQMEYIATKDLGYDKEHVLVIPTQSGWSDASDKMVERFRTRLEQEPAVTSVAGTSASFNKGYNRYGYTIDGEHKSAYVYGIDTHYIPLLGLEIVDGRNFDERISTDSNAVIVNEALVRDMKWKVPLNEYLNWQEDSLGIGSRVIGVVKDYHYRSLEGSIEPMLLSMNHKEVGYLENILVKLAPGEVKSGIGTLEKAWREIAPDFPFDYTFVDDDVARQYESYERWMSIMGFSTAFAILISCLGLFGLSGINALNRTREIGIRKVMGAEVWNIFLLLNRQYLWLAFIAFLLAVPASWFAMREWLADFTFAISMRWEFFAASMLAGLFVALVTVSYHAIKASLINPAETLKHE